MLKDEVKTTIQSAYSRFLKAKELKPRHGQKLMVAAIARTLGGVVLNNQEERTGSANHICVVEAGTGTGKTVAYLLATVPVAKAMGKKVVVATATVALQEQIVFKDLPDLKRHSGLDFQYGLAKGRGRYLCLSKLDRLMNQDGDPSLPLYEEDEAGISASDQALYEQMLSALTEQRWDGDRDNWPEELAAPSWQRVTTDHRQCTGRRCRFVRQCAFFQARESINDMDCIVANHDLVLADLALGGGVILPAPKDTIYVFDEGHHLPDKAVNHFSARARVVATSRWLGQTEGQWTQYMEPLKAAVGFQELAAPVEGLLKVARRQLDALQPLLTPFLEEMDRSQPVVRYRFPQGEAPLNLRNASEGLESAFLNVFSQLDKLCRALDDLLENEHSPVPKVDLENLYPLLGSWCSRAEANAVLWRSFAKSEVNPKWPVARWMTLHEYGEAVDFELVASPILASHTLSANLWQTCCAAVVTSATLTALGSFDRFRLRAGTPEEALYEVVPSPFDFARNATLRVPSSAVEGNQRELHTDSVIRLLPKLAGPKQAVLVLFASRRQMLDVYDAIPESLRTRVLVQGNESKQLLLKKHREQVDAGQGSVLFGLASFAEGVDLPGRYCEHVIIAKLPFSVPDDPVEAAMGEWIEAQGGNSFMQMAVPDAAIKLVQACGRLLRTETDTGVITVLDRRLVSKRYGSAILQSLPPFKQELHAPD